MTDLDSTPSDMMCRRTPLLLCRRFFLLGYTVMINTNSQSILRAAGRSWFLPVLDTDQNPDMKWEIVGTQSSRAVSDWKCNVTTSGHSIYLSMGPEQWFAFDLETYDGAGFLLIDNSDPKGDTNTELYLHSIACNLSVNTRIGLERKTL